MSVFRAANNVNKVPADRPYPINQRPRDEAIPDGPTERIDDRKSRVRRDRIASLGVVFAVFALITSSIAVLAAWRAVSLARLVAMSMPAAAGATAPPGSAGFSVTYAREPLRVQVGCSAVLFVDLDEPRANADEQVSDLRYDSRCGQDVPRLTLGPGAAAGAQVKDSDTDADGCQRAIRTTPIGPGGGVQVRKGAVLCVLTAAIPPSMSLVEITDVGTTGTAGMRATSWKVTG
ncbi:hypothetical protein ACIA5D_22235 [Actinoplanes sp. NPDC051513]|uniref:hypothetical protein n=1 Tax=Actinoplanes sp. NPDC051513 TaxID=3363908 RepID=UPI0037A95C6F